MEIIEAHTPEQLAQIKALFTEYFDFIKREFGIDLGYQNIAEELRSLPGKYAPPQGRLLLALEGGQAMACAALRPLEPGVVELKRMYTRPQYRRRGAARALAERLIQIGRESGYRLMRLDTATFLPNAIRLYESLGFKRCTPYYQAPDDILIWAVFMELTLGRNGER